MKVYLVDNLNTGHHEIYQRNINKIENTFIKNKIINFKSIKSNYFKAFKERRKFLESIKSEVEKDSLIHFLYVDSLYKCPIISKELVNNKKIKYIGTLHWIPVSVINKYMLKSFCKKLELIIVHSEYLKQKLYEMGIKNVEYIDYPSFIKNKNQKSIKENDKIVISCLGGTRSDKGLDVLLNSFKYIDESKKDKIIFNISGKEQDIKFDDIKRSAEDQNINIVLKNKFLTDEEYENEICKSDVILLPYKKNFSGNSGPMTDGIYMNKFIVGPNEGNLGYLIDKYDLGLVFKQEDPEDLGKKISRLPEIDINKNHEYRNELDVYKFTEKYKYIYKCVENGIKI